MIKIKRKLCQKKYIKKNKNYEYVDVIYVFAKYLKLKSNDEQSTLIKFFQEHQVNLNSSKL